MIRRFLRRGFLADRSGATILEFCLFAALIAVTLIGSLNLFSSELKHTLLIAATHLVTRL